MAKQTFTFTAASGLVSKRTSETKVYTHVVLFGAEGEETASSWHTSQEQADKKARYLRTCPGRDSFKDIRITVAPVDAPAAAKPVYHPAARHITRLLLGR